MTNDYSQLTEIPGSRASQEQLRRMYTRYHFAREYSREKDVLEVACGSGLGLRYISKAAKTVVGGDFTLSLLNGARSYNSVHLPFLGLDAHALPFKNHVFDVVVLYEAIYYLRNPRLFIGEARRVLREKGLLIVCLPNKNLPDFHPSPHSFHYYSSRELKELVESEGFVINLFGDSPADYSSLRGRFLSGLKKKVVRLNLMPKTLKGRELLKKLVYGRLIPIPPEITDDLCEYVAPESLPTDWPDSRYRVLYAVARVKEK